MFARATILDKMRWEISNLPRLLSNKDGKITHFGFYAASSSIWRGGGGGVHFFVSVQDGSSTGYSNNLMIFWLKKNMSAPAYEISQNDRQGMWYNFLFLKSVVISSSYVRPANCYIYFTFIFFVLGGV